MENDKGVLLGLTTTEDLWALIHPLAIVGWMLLLVAPFWKRALVYTKIPALFYAVLYALILIPKIVTDDGDPPDISKMESIQALFQDKDVFFCGWIHYLAFDLLVGTIIAEDAIAMPVVYYYLAVAPCLFLTFYLGPVGYLLYTLLKSTVLPATPTKAKES